MEHPIKEPATMEHCEETSNFQILSYKIVTYIKRNLRACAIRIYQENWISLQKKSFFLNFLHTLETIQKFYCSICSKFRKKKLQKLLFWDLSNSERNKVTNFDEHSPISLEITDKWMVVWDKLTHSCLKWG